MEKEKGFTQRDAINFAVGAAMLLTAACGAKPEPSNLNNSGNNQNPTEIPQTQLYIPQEPQEQESLIEEIPQVCVDFGNFGTYCAELNSYTGREEIAWHDDNQVEEGTDNLVDLKVEGGVVEFEMPKDGIINSIAGDIEVTTKDENGKEVTENLIPGNPVIDESENPLIPAHAQVKITYEENNPSNGLLIEFEAETTFENLRMDWGDYGISKAVYDENKNAYMVTLDDWCLIKKGIKNLETLKIEGGQFEFIMPFDGFVNNSAGVIVRDEEEDLLLGNPVVNEDGDPLIKAGDKIVITYEAGNDSAGFQLEFPVLP